jgi:hypothetical protein
MSQILYLVTHLQSLLLFRAQIYQSLTARSLRTKLIMAPSFDTLSDHDFQEDDIEDEIDFSDLREQYDVRMEEGLDTFCVRSGDWGSNVSN